MHIYSGKYTKLVNMQIHAYDCIVHDEANLHIFHLFNFENYAPIRDGNDPRV